MTASGSLGIRLKTSVRSELLILGTITALAAFTRLYQLGSFPYFPVPPPWVGSSTYPGLYVDEGSRLGEIALFPHALTSYEPSIQILLVKTSIFLLGQNYFAYRLPSALASILTAVLLYFAAKQLYKSKAAAFVSSLYLIVMIPALIYGRMIFYENLVALFLVVTIYCISKFEEEGLRRWLYLGAFASVLAVLGKVDGLFVPLFFTIWAMTGERRKEKVLPLALMWSPLIMGGAVIVAIVGSLNGVFHQWILGVTGRELSFNFMVIQTLPSAYDVVAGGFFKPEFWYLFSYLCLAAMLVKGSSGGKLLLIVLLTYFLLEVGVWGMGSYYLISVFPIMALAVGGGSPLIAKLGTTPALAFYGAFYAPLVASYIASFGVPTFLLNYPLFLLKGGLFVIPLLLWLALDKASLVTLKNRFPLAVIVLASLFALLLLGTPELYSYYFQGKPLG